MKTDDEERNQRRFRWKFFSRSKVLQDYKNGKVKPGKVMRKFPNYLIFRPLVPKIEELESNKDIFLNELKKIVVGVPSIEVVHDEKGKELKIVPLNYLARIDGYLQLMENWIKQHPKQFKKQESLFGLQNAVDKGDKTILIKIHLDRKRKNILKDFKYLLDLVDREVKYGKLDLGRLRPRWGEYQTHLDVYDFRKQNKSWREIAHLVYPGDESTDSAIRKVRHHYQQAKKMIAGGWMQI